MAVDGTWNISIETPIGTRQATLNVAAAGNALTGTQGADGNSTGESRVAVRGTACASGAVSVENGECCGHAR